MNINTLWFVLAITLPILGIFLLALWISMFFHLIQNNNVKNKVIWFTVLVFTGVIGGVIYYFIVKRKLDKQINNPVLEKL